MSKKNKLYFTYYEHITGGERLSDDDWSDYAPTRIDWNLDKCFKHEHKAAWIREVYEVDFDVKVGDIVHVVYVRYNTGDTFNCVRGAWAILDVCQNQKQAEKIKQSVYDNTYKGHKCWEGFFESFDSCAIDQMLVQ